MSYKLHCFGESGHSYKVALALQLAGLNWEAVHLDFFMGAHRSDDYRAVNAMAEAPVLEDGDIRLSQSGVILQYLADTTGHFAPTETDRYEVLRWVLWDNHKFSSQLGVTRFLMNFLPPEKRSAETIAFQQGRVKAAFAVLDAHLDGRDWIVGDGISHADLSCCSYLFYPEGFGVDPADFPHVSSWMERIRALPRWAHPYDLMQRAYKAA